jgi:single-strand DNA-binding protein
MSQDNQITLRGFLTAEPKYHQTRQHGTPVTEIRIGSTPRRLDRETGEWVDLPTSYYTVRCWRRLAINAVGSLHKGDMVVVRGRFYMRSWTDSQERQRSVLEIEADSLGHDLAHGWTHYMRGARQHLADGPAGDGGELARQGAEPAGHGDAEFPGGPEWDTRVDTELAGPTSLATGGTGQGGGTDGEGGEADDGVGHAEAPDDLNLVGVTNTDGDLMDAPNELALTVSR